MANIAEKLEGVIDKLDTMSSSPIPRTYGLDIASRVEHIANQLDGVESGGSSGGGNIMVVNFTLNYTETSATADKTFDQIETLLNNGGFAIGRDNKKNTYMLSCCRVGDGENAYGDDYIVFSLAYYFDGTNMGMQYNALEVKQFEMFRNGQIVYKFYQNSN